MPGGVACWPHGSRPPIAAEASWPARVSGLSEIFKYFEADELIEGTNEAVGVLEAAGYDIVLIETVGVGQGEGEIVELAQTIVAVIAPGLGDEVQAMKAGLLEVAHLVVLNKADRPDAESTVQALQDWVAQVISTVAVKGEGIQAVIEAIAFHQQSFNSSTLTPA